MAFRTSVSMFHCLLFLWLVGGGRVKCSDDVNVMQLQALVQQQAATITDLQAKVTSLVNLNAEVTELKVNLNAEVTQLKAKLDSVTRPVAFSAMLSTDERINGFPLSHHATLVLDEVVTNNGNGYDSNTGIFTAPIAGVYVFSLNTMVPDSYTHGNLGLAIVKQGVVLDMAWAPANTEDIGDQGSTLVSTQLTAGEKVWVRQVYGNAVRGSYWTVFTGYLLQALYP